MAETIRTSMTKSQIATVAGNALLTLLVDITNDGILSDEEITTLHNWLAANQEQPIPAIARLTKALAVYAQPGTSAHNDKACVLKAIEAALPVNDRKLAASQRREAEKSGRQLIKEQEAKEKQRQRELLAQEKQKNKHVYVADFMVAGAKRKEYSENIDMYADIGDPALFERDRGNEHDDNATYVLTKGYLEMGYVPRAEAKAIAKLLDSGHKYRATIKKILGYDKPIPVIRAYFYPPEATLPKLETYKEPKGCGCLAVILIAAITIPAYFLLKI